MLCSRRVQSALPGSVAMLRRQSCASECQAVTNALMTGEDLFEGSINCARTNLAHKNFSLAQPASPNSEIFKPSSEITAGVSGSSK